MTVRTRTATVLSHARPAQTAEALRALIEAAEREGVLLRFDAEETRKYGLTPREGLVLDAPLSDDVELCVSLGGDGTILRALRRYAGTSVPVFAVNYGEVGFLATIDPDEDGDLLSVHNRSQGEVDISLDGRPSGQLGPGDAISASFLREAADLAQVPGSSFYRRLRQKFGRLAS